MKIPNLNQRASKNIAKRFAAALTLLILLSFSQFSVALSLQDAKAQGMVGEQSTGYLGVVKAGGGAEALVKSTNAQRKKYYQDIAKRNKTNLPSVEKLAGKKAIAKTAKGHFIKSGGGWKKK